MQDEKNNEEKKENLEDLAREEKISELEILKQSVEDAQALNRELNDKILRLNAEFANYKTRVEKEKFELLKYSCQETLILLLPFLDAFESALKAKHNNFDECLKGFELLQKSLLDILQKEGLEKIIATGEKFNPAYHEAIGFDSREDLDENVITCEMQSGYKLKEKVLRHSIVKINKK